MGSHPNRGHRTRPHTADITVEAWAPSRGGCIAEAVLGFIEGFADVSGATPLGTRDLTVATDDPAEQLVTVLDEVIYLLDTAGEVPLAVEIGEDGGELQVRFRTAAVNAVTQVGAIPKAVSLHGLTFARRKEHWRCQVTIDV